MALGVSGGAVLKSHLALRPSLVCRTWRGGPRRGGKEIRDVDVEGAGELPEQRYRETVAGAFVLLDLLEADADRVRKLLLGQAQ